jgi:carboxyl-terminal processing protease
MNVVLVGVSKSPGNEVRTYGKPVGFFDINIGSYKLYLSMYQDKNANNEGDFFDGFLANYSVLDDIKEDFGSLNDPAMQQIVHIKEHPAALSKRSNVSALYKSRYFFNKDPANGLIKTKKDFKLKSHVQIF